MLLINVLLFLLLLFLGYSSFIAFMDGTLEVRALLSYFEGSSSHIGDNP